MRAAATRSIQAPPVSRRTMLAVPALALGVVAVVAAGWAVGYRDVDVWGTFGVPAVLATLTLPFIRRTERNRLVPLAGLLALALAVKFLGAFARYLMVFELYETGDSVRYLDAGSPVAQRFWNGELASSALIPTTQGTPFIEQLSGLVQTIFGQSAMGSFMVFAWLSFLGMWAFVAAGRRAVPTLDTRRYALLVLFLPSMVFWPSSVGKDAWMVFTLGIFALGASRIYTHGRGGFVLAALAIGGMGMVRPHVALLALAGLGVGFLVRKRRPTAVAGAPAAQKVIGLLLVIVGFTFALSQAAQVLPGFGEDGSGSVTDVLEETSRRSTQGRSEVEVTTPNSPLQYPLAFITVMFRPFIFEATSATAAVAAIESTGLIVLAVASRRRIAAAIRDARQTPYVLMAGIYVLTFAFAWSALGNLGIIARQRVQVLPFLVLFLAVVPGRRPGDEDSVASEALATAHRG